ncbi:MAG: EscU/YscU/HrcU family type III secretion system export apparatus switch protein [Hyphomicrobiales bacterium]|nr:EscU/YscU/HrcU family type III secretion system export apparatus switch protein [Hyphomicrobiales bacterium]
MAEKTEMPTPKRLRDARMKGQLLFSREVVSVATLMASFGLLLAIFSPLAEGILSALILALESPGKDFMSRLSVVVAAVLQFFLFGGGLVVAAAALSGIVGNLVQIGFYFSFVKLTKGFEALNAINNAKNIVSKKSFYTLGLNIAKVLIISFVGWQMLRAQTPDLVASVHCGLACVAQLGANNLIGLTVTLTLIFVVLAGVDYLVQRHFYLSELKMSIDEVKRELKETEGSPEIKAFRKQAHRDAIETQMLDGAEQASALVTNPSHYAVALRYDEAETPLPFITAKGQGALALAMRRRAEAAQVPVVEEPELARGLYHEADVHEFIPQEFFAPVAQVLRYIAQQRG